ncbi:lytic murein transglycosylase [Hippea maritima]|uniref:lytic murein transglycosylase n=1 Tax=Hippea maritima TaxID=84405 RepID=UPI00145F1386|nr:lytic murein transglycosylase [Hippea maritima]
MSYPVYGFNIDEIAVKLNARYNVPVEYTHYVLSKAKVVDNVRSFVERVANSPEKTFVFGDFVKFFVNKRRIKEGVEFYKSHRKLLNRVYQEFGVDPCVVVAILSIETNFGRIKLTTNALDALYTLSLYSKRKRYFLSELESFIVYTFRHRVNPFSVKGSITGALGIPQFMPSNIDRYGVDFNGNGLNLNEVDDATASIANYLLKHGWKKDKPVVKFLSNDSKLCRRLNAKNLNGGKVITFNYGSGVRCFVAYDNFWALKKYNGTKNYAMAVYELSEEICKKIR